VRGHDDESDARYLASNHGAHCHLWEGKVADGVGLTERGEDLGERDGDLIDDVESVASHEKSVAEGRGMARARGTIIARLDHVHSVVL